MFWKKKTPEEKLRAEYEKLMKESYDLSKTNRAKADEKFAQAENIMKELERLSGDLS